LNTYIGLSDKKGEYPCIGVELFSKIRKYRKIAARAARRL